jgi:excisionase family DNA binding protein
MSELLTTDEAANYLRLSERKLYELVASGAVPCTKVTGRWLFPRDALDRWVLAGMSPAGAVNSEPPPPIIGGSHDPLLEWALRESGCGLANLAEGSEQGLRRLVRDEVMGAAIHLHRLEGDDEQANAEGVRQMQGLHDAVLVDFARREQGFLVAPGNPLGLTDIVSVVTRQARVAQRPPGAGAQLLLIAMLARASSGPEKLLLLKTVCPTGFDVAQAIRAGRADCGIATRSVARAAALDFLPVTWERFDLVFRQRNYFLPAAQRLLTFLHTPQFRERANELGGYDISAAGEARLPI